MEATAQINDLRGKVFLLADYACGTVGEAVEDLLADPATTLEQRVWLQQLRLDVARSMIATASNPDPVTDLFQQLFLIRVARMIVEREAPKVMGAQGDELITVFRTLDTAAWEGTSNAIGQPLTPLNNDAEYWIEANPDTNRFWWAREMGLLQALGSTDLVHYSGLFASVNRANEGIDRLNLTLARTSFVIERLPMLASWELQAAVATLLARPDSQAFAKGPEALAKSLTALDESIASRFGEVGSQLKGVRAELGNTSSELQLTSKTIGSALAGTSEALSTTVSDLQKTLETQSAALAGSVDDSAREIDLGSNGVAASLDELATTIDAESNRILGRVDLMENQMRTEGRAMLNSVAWRVGIGAGILVVIAVVLSVMGAWGVSRLTARNSHAP